MDGHRQAVRHPPAGSRPRRRWLRRLLWLPVCFVLLTLLQVLPLRWIDPPTSAFMLARQIEGIGNEGFRLRQEWRDWEQISPQLPIALVVAEDQKFTSRRGIDLETIHRTNANNARGGNSSGGSDISQQVDKNL